MLEAKRYYNASMTLFEPDSVTAQEMNINRRAPEPLSKYRLPKNAFVTSDLTSAFRKASEVILVPPRRRLAEVVAQILNTSEQGLRVVVGTCGFEPESHRLPCQLVMDMAKARGRDDVSVFALVGAVQEEHVLTGKSLSGMLAGPKDQLRILSDLFLLKHVNLVTSDDPLGVQAASILARALCALGALSQPLRGDPGRGPGGCLYGPGQPRRPPSWAWPWADRPTASPPEARPGLPPWWPKASRASAGNSGSNWAARPKSARTYPSPPGPCMTRWRAMGKRLTGYEDIRSAYMAARRLDLQLPIMEEAYATIWGGDLSHFK